MSGSQVNGNHNLQASLPMLCAFHSTQASTLRFLYSSQPDIYQVLTFPTILVSADQIIPIILAVEENLEWLRIDVGRFVPLPFESGQPNLRVVIRGTLDLQLSEENQWAALRYLKEARAGHILVQGSQRSELLVFPHEPVQNEAIQMVHGPVQYLERPDHQLIVQTIGSQPPKPLQ